MTDKQAPTLREICQQELLEEAYKAKKSAIKRNLLLVDRAENDVRYFRERLDDLEKQDPMWFLRERFNAGHPEDASGAHLTARTVIREQ